MTGIERTASPRSGSAEDGPEFPPVLDLVPVASASSVSSPPPSTPAATRSCRRARTLAGAAFLGAVTDAMLLGHWYLVQPGLPRRLLHELVDALGWVWPIEVVALLLPTGMLSVWTGAVDDGWNGTLGWFWAACAVTTIVLVVVTKAALREREYSAVMAATGLLYLAILTAFGTDLVARAVLAGLTGARVTPVRAYVQQRIGQDEYRGMPRPVWSGTISFGLIAIPIKLFHAVRRKSGVVQPARRAHDEPHPLPQGVRRDGRRGARRAHRQGLRGLQGPLRPRRPGRARAVHPGRHEDRRARGVRRPRPRSTRSTSRTPTTWRPTPTPSRTCCSPGRWRRPARSPSAAS